MIRRNPSSGELAFYLCWSPKRVPLSELVRVAGTRWCIEECFQAAKGQIGLDHYQVRHWAAWHRHITLAVLALAFLAALAADATPARTAQSNRPARSSDSIDLTVPEIRHLLGTLLSPPNTSPRKLLHWSNWRRTTRPQPGAATTSDDSPHPRPDRSRSRNGVLEGTLPRMDCHAWTCPRAVESRECSRAIWRR